MGNHTESNQSIGTGQDENKQGAIRDGSQRETGGSGGAGQTASQVSPGNAQSSTSGPAQTGRPVEAEGSDATATTRGAQDTRSRQAGDAQLGSPETGANQSPADLPHPRGR